MTEKTVRLRWRWAMSSHYGVSISFRIEERTPICQWLSWWGEWQCVYQKRCDDDAPINPRMQNTAQEWFEVYAETRAKNGERVIYEGVAVDQ